MTVQVRASEEGCRDARRCVREAATFTLADVQSALKLVLIRPFFQITLLIVARRKTVEVRGGQSIHCASPEAYSRDLGGCMPQSLALHSVGSFVHRRSLHEQIF